MIKEINDKSKVESILKKNFSSYVFSLDPFEKVYGYEKNGIVGLISISIMYDRAEINYIVVRETNRSMGIGSRLLQFVIDMMFKNGVNSVSLEVETSNFPAISLYEKFGFVKKSVRKNYYGAKDAYLMVRDLR